MVLLATGALDFILRPMTHLILNGLLGLFT
jgi:hypothetical protein